ncbi:hypothetical protein HXX76_010020 [Chlamydomonas incerta]|uniref:Protein kinase domain-containing protein n=1 Tax=Chlamydomonas incerta TaxID=51695 RepID=A0A835VV50_CHLIN|nr:hypothetical protein HXX76_010020 [Chlamydomonas incerta]|eukprot:KAG2430497.1 hypothetical protein HXX76_010020 [Chlamydomonas incerta]
MATSYPAQGPEARRGLEAAKPAGALRPVPLLALSGLGVSREANGESGECGGCASPHHTELGASAPCANPLANSCTVDGAQAAPNNISAPSPGNSPRPAPASPRQQCQALRDGVARLSNGHVKHLPSDSITAIYQEVLHESRDGSSGIAHSRTVRVGALVPPPPPPGGRQQQQAIKGGGGGGGGGGGQYTEMLIHAETLELPPHEYAVLEAGGNLVPQQLKCVVAGALAVHVANANRRAQPAAVAAALAAAAADPAADAAALIAPLLGYDVVFVARGIFLFTTFWEVLSVPPQSAPPPPPPPPAAAAALPLLTNRDALVAGIAQSQGYYLPAHMPAASLVETEPRKTVHRVTDAADRSTTLRKVDKVVTAAHGAVACKSSRFQVSAAAVAELAAGTCTEQRMEREVELALREVRLAVMLERDFASSSSSAGSSSSSAGSSGSSSSSGAGSSKRRRLPVLLGWDVEELCAADGAYNFVTYWEWAEHGSVLHYVWDCMTTPAADGSHYRKVLDVFFQVVDHLGLLSRTGHVLGDLKHDNLLVNAQGDVLISDVDGAGWHMASTLAPVQVEAAAAAAAAAAACADPSPKAKAAAAAAAEAAVFADRLDTVPVPAAPYMATWPYAAPEMFVGQVLADLRAKSLAVVAAEAQAAGHQGAVALLAQLYRECPDSKDAQLARLAGMHGGRDSMCAASHAYLLAASTIDLVTQVGAALRKQPGQQQQPQQLEQDLLFLTDLGGAMRPLLTATPETRPGLRQLRAALAQLEADWC